MITAIIKNGEYETKIRFPCREKELNDSLRRVHLDGGLLAPAFMIKKIEPKELSVLENGVQSLDALNFLGKRLYGFDELEYHQFLAILGCEKLEIEWDLKKIVNLTYNLPHYTLIEDTSDLAKVGQIHLLNKLGALPLSETQNKEKMKSIGQNLLDSGNGIQTEYGLIFVNEEVETYEPYKGRSIPIYYCEPNAEAEIEVWYGDERELICLPDDEIAFKKTLSRLGTESFNDCMLSIISDNTGYFSEGFGEIDAHAMIFEVNRLLNEAKLSIFRNEIIRKLSSEGYNVTADKEWLTVALNGASVAKINDRDILYTDEDFFDNDKSGISPLSQVVREAYEYCSAYNKALPLKAEGLPDNYRYLSEFNGTVLAAKYSEQYGFEFVIWDRTFDGKAVCQGNYHNDYLAAKEDFAIRSGLVNSDRLFSVDDLEYMHKCIAFALENDDSLNYEQEKELTELKERIEDIAPCQTENQEQGFQNLSM